MVDLGGLPMADDEIIYIPGHTLAEEAIGSWLNTVKEVQEHLESSYAGLEEIHHKSGVLSNHGRSYAIAVIGPPALRTALAHLESLLEDFYGKMSERHKVDDLGAAIEGVKTALREADDESVSDEVKKAGSERQSAARSDESSADDLHEAARPSRGRTAHPRRSASRPARQTTRRS
jgi:hypothetical protein